MSDSYPTAPSDAELLERSRREPELFGDFYDRHAVAVMAYCLRRTGSRSVASELTAEVFAAAYATRARFRSTAAPAIGWLYGIARRQIGTYHRKQRVADRYRRRLAIDVALSTDDDLDRIDDGIDMHDVRAALPAALDTLPRGQAEAVRMRVVQQLSYREVAAALSCSEGAARVRVSRGLTRLAEILEVEDDRHRRP